MDGNLFTMSLCSSFAIYANFQQIMYHVFVRLISQRHGQPAPLLLYGF